MDDNSGIVSKPKLRAEFGLAQLDFKEAEAIRERRRKHKLTFKETTRLSVRERKLAISETHNHDAVWKAQKKSLISKQDYHFPSPYGSNRAKVENIYRAIQRKYTAGRERLDKFHKHVQSDIRENGHTLSGEFRKRASSSRKKGKSHRI